MSVDHREREWDDYCIVHDLACCTGSAECRKVSLLPSFGGQVRDDNQENNVLLRPQLNKARGAI